VTANPERTHTVNPSLDIAELQELLRRCEGEAATEADILALGALLEEQESGDGWAAIRTGLRGGLQREADRCDLASGVIRQVALSPAVSEQALDALRGGLRAEAERADLAEAIMHFVDPTPELLLDRHIDALAAGLHREAQRAPVGLVGAVLDTVAPDRDVTVERALELLAAELSTEASRVELVEPVMTAVRQDHLQDLALCAMVDGELAGEAKRALAARLADDVEGRQAITAMAELGRQLRRALAHETAGHELGDLWAGVAARAGIQERVAWAEEFAAGIQAEAGDIDIADRVMDSILPPVRQALPEAEALAPTPARQPVPLRSDPWFRRLPLLSFALSAAALLLVINAITPEPIQPGPQPGPGPGPELAEVIFEISDVNTIEIEELEVAQDAMVQVFQLEEGAPMVILIDEGLEADSVEGVTL
jgi:hypothetical protein